MLFRAHREELCFHLSSQPVRLQYDEPNLVYSESTSEKHKDKSIYSLLYWEIIHAGIHRTRWR